MVEVLRPAEIVDADRLDATRHPGISRGIFQSLAFIFLTAFFRSTYQNRILESIIFLTSFIRFPNLQRVLLRLNGTRHRQHSDRSPD